MASSSKGKKSSQDKPWFHLAQQNQHWQWEWGGCWRMRFLHTMEKPLQTLLNALKSAVSNRIIQITLHPQTTFDTAGAFVFVRTINLLKEQGATIRINSSDQEILSLINSVSKQSLNSLPLQEKLPWYHRLLAPWGSNIMTIIQTAQGLLAFLGHICIVGSKIIFNPRQKLRWVSIFKHMETVGYNALFIVGLISFLIGMVLAYQSINQLSRFGAELYTVDFLGIAVLREIGVLLTAIIVAGRSGSAFAAQLGTMALNQEIDALRMLGLDPMSVLVVPRLIALLISLPLLVFFANIMGILGGMVLTTLTIDLSSQQFVTHFRRSVSPTHFWVGMSKVPLFAILIALVGCFRGLQVKGSTENVGRMTTQSVVESIFLVIVFDALISILFSYLKI